MTLTADREVTTQELSNRAGDAIFEGRQLVSESRKLRGDGRSLVELLRAHNSWAGPTLATKRFSTIVREHPGLRS